MGITYGDHGEDLMNRRELIKEENRHRKEYSPEAERVEALKRKRISDGVRTLDKLWSADLPWSSGLDSADVTMLREIICGNFGRTEVRGMVKAIEPEDFKPGYVSTSVNLRPEHVKMLFRLAGFPLIDADWHGSCGDCRWSLDGKERGWQVPCSGCGSGHPCFEPREGAQ